MESMEKAKERLQKQMEALQQQMDFIDNFDFSKKLNEDEWHLLCKTPMRNSESLAIVLQNIFPLAENIFVNSNWVSFTLYGFNCLLPTTYCSVIHVSFSWYHRLKEVRASFKRKETYYLKNIQFYEDYLNAIDTHASWKKLVTFTNDYRKFYQNYRPWALFFLYWFKLRKTIHRDEIQSKYDKLLKEYNDEKIYLKAHEKKHAEQLSLFLYTVAPILLSFIKDPEKITSSNRDRFSPFSLSDMLERELLSVGDLYPKN